MAKRMVWVVLLFFAVVKGSPSQTFTSLFSFDGANGEFPGGPLVQGPNGNFYGTTFYGGAHETLCPEEGCGTLYEITPAGQLTTIYNFCSQTACADGNIPEAGVIVGPGGNLYGTTDGGGAMNYGTVFRIAPNGQLTTLYSFCTQSSCPDGSYPTGLVQAPNGNFYGTTAGGGLHGGGGTIFEITTAGVLTTIYSFCALPNCEDGNYPWGGWL